ncbi:MAG: DUF3102 domain-containing protein [Lachnospiraceae bacterium]|nr:DUF3102 domain-containing protein [Lachnospiraceae bacterium]
MTSEDFSEVMEQFDNYYDEHGKNLLMLPNKITSLIGSDNLADALDDIGKILLQLNNRREAYAYKMGVILSAVKAKLPHGSYEKWVEDKLPFSLSLARVLVKVAREFSYNPQLVVDLGIAKAEIISRIKNLDERDRFINGSHIIGGKNRNVFKMSKSELISAYRKYMLFPEQQKKIPESILLEITKTSIITDRNDYLLYLKKVREHVNNLVARLEKDQKDNDSDEILSKIFSVSKQTIYKEMKSGKFGEPVRIGRAYKIPKIFIWNKFFINYN